MLTPYQDCVRTRSSGAESSSESHSLDLDAARAGPAVVGPPDGGRRERVSRGRSRVLDGEESCERDASRNNAAPCQDSGRRTFPNEKRTRLTGRFGAYCGPDHDHRASPSCIETRVGAVAVSLVFSRVSSRHIFLFHKKTRRRVPKLQSQLTLGQALDALRATTVHSLASDIRVAVHGSRCRDGRSAEEGGASRESEPLHGRRERAWAAGSEDEGERSRERVTMGRNTGTRASRRERRVGSSTRGVGRRRRRADSAGLLPFDASSSIPRLLLIDRSNYGLLNAGAGTLPRRKSTQLSTRCTERVRALPLVGEVPATQLSSKSMSLFSVLFPMQTLYKQLFCSCQVACRHRPERKECGERAPSAHLPFRAEPYLPGCTACAPP